MALATCAAPDVALRFVQDAIERDGIVCLRSCKGGSIRPQHFKPAIGRQTAITRAGQKPYSAVIAVTTLLATSATSGSAVPI